MGGMFDFSVPNWEPYLEGLERPEEIKQTLDKAVEHIVDHLVLLVGTQPNSEVVLCTLLRYLLSSLSVRFVNRLSEINGYPCICDLPHINVQISHTTGGFRITNISHHTFKVLTQSAIAADVPTPADGEMKAYQLYNIRNGRACDTVAALRHDGGWLVEEHLGELSNVPKFCLETWVEEDDNDLHTRYRHE